MSSKDIRQTHKEFVERNKRLGKKQTSDSRKEEKLNEIKDIEDIITERKNEIKKLRHDQEVKKREYNEIHKSSLQQFSCIYNNPDLIMRIIELAKQTTYSDTSIKDIENSCSNGINEDNIDWDTIEKITLAEKRIIQEIPHTNIVSDFFDRFGNSVGLPSEEDND